MYRLDSQDSRIFDIRREIESTDLRKQITDGLSSKPRRMPSLLLWDDEGQRLFNAFAQTSSYYIRQKELEILNRIADDIVANAPDGSVLVELGCGNLEKTAIILSAFERQQRKISYYALDVSFDELRDSINSLVERHQESNFVEINGLWGTYNDCTAWIASFADDDIHNFISFLWIGNSIANLQRSDVRSLLEQFDHACNKSNVNYQFIIGADSCNQEGRILEAYDTTNQLFRTFLLNGLHAANAVTGCEKFQDRDWSCMVEFDTREHELLMYYTPLRDISIEIGGHQIAISEGEKVHIVTSGKWREVDVEAICTTAGLGLSDIWRDSENMYCLYLARRALPPPSSHLSPFQAVLSFVSGLITATTKKRLGV